MLNYHFDKDAVYIVACTYGPDSMALLDMVQKDGVKPVVAAINYNRFRDGDNELMKLREYCEERELIFEYFDAATLPDDEQYQEGQDFTKWARNLRYDFFLSLYAKYGAAALLLAHQQDDLLEAYLKQKEGKAGGSSYEFSPVSTYKGMMIVRPLLHFSRDDLIDYNEENRVPYSLKEEQYENEFTRSKLRKDVISKLSEIDRERLLEEMAFVNDDKSRFFNDVITEIKEGEELDIRSLISLTHDEFAATLTTFIHKYSPKIKITPAKLSSIRAFMLNEKATDVFRLAEGVYLIKEYDVVSIGDNFDELPYSYVLKEPGKLETEQFDLDFSMGAEDRHIYPEDYPITIRTAIPTDMFVVDSYLQQVRSLYNMWQMPAYLKNVWPVFVNCKGKIIYVPRYRVDFSEYHTSILKMHIKKEG